MDADWKLEGVCVRTEDGTAVLRDVAAQFRCGAITLLIGRNGAGKSTLLESIAGLRRLAAGEIRLGGDSLWTSGRRQRKRRLNRGVILRLGIAMQQSESQWFAATAREELLYSLRPYRLPEPERTERMEAAISAVGLQPELLERDPWTLSGGQQRRLALACLLACEPDWLLLDEPTAGLDAEGKAALCAVLEAQRKAGRGAIVATHDLEALLPLADAVLVVDGGTLREASPPQLECREAPRELARRLARQLAANGRMELPPPAAACREESAPATAAAEEQPPKRRRVWLDPRTFDPRMVVIAYLALTACLLTQNSMAKLALSAIVTAAAVAPFWPLVRGWLPVVRGFALITVILIAIGGLSLDPLSFRWERTEATAVRLVQLLLIMVLGMPILGLMTPLRLQRALDQTFGWLARLSVPVQTFTLLVTLVFRFMPLLLREWSRFAKLARARGKAAAPPGAFPAKQLSAMLIPYLRAILRLAEGMADALEARGFGAQRKEPVYGFRLKPGRADARLLGAALGGCALLLLIGAAL